MLDGQECALYNTEENTSPKEFKTFSEFWKKTSEISEVLKAIICAIFYMIVLFSMIHWLLMTRKSITLMDDTAAHQQSTKPHTPIIMLRDSVLMDPNNPVTRLLCSNNINNKTVIECEIKDLSPDYADAYIFYAKFTNSCYPLPRNKNVLWGLINEESPIFRLELMHENYLNLFNFSSTYSRFSDVPIPLVWIGAIDHVTDKTYYLNTEEKNKLLLEELAPVFYMQSNCDTATERDAYVKELMNHIAIDSYGLCGNNKNLGLDPMLSYTANRYYLDKLEDDKLLRFLSRYKFTITIENGICNDYVTEKFWRAIRIGTVPIYYGSPLIRDWLPNNKSAILLEDFPTPELLSRHLHYLLRNDTAYEEYLEHKTLGLIRNENLINEAMRHPYQYNFDDIVEKLECLICERLHDKDSTKVNIVTRKHLDCPVPKSALTLFINPDNKWVQKIANLKPLVDEMANVLKVTNVTDVTETYELCYTSFEEFSR